MGGGIWSSGSLTLENGTLVEDISPPRFGRRVRGYNGFGGGVYIAGGSANISNTTFTGNSAIGGLGDGGIGSDGSGLGGALYVAAGHVVLTTSTVENNEANGYFRTGDTSYGGGLYVAGGTVTLSNDTVQSNYVQDSSAFGGGLYVAGGTVTLYQRHGGIQFARRHCFELRRRPVRRWRHGNSYQRLGGIQFAKRRWRLFEATYGGGLYVAVGTVILASDTVESNVASPVSSFGGGIYIASAATVCVDSFTLAHLIDNTASTDPNIDGTYILT